MTLVTEGVIHEVFFGFDAERLMLRIDTQRAAKEDLARLQEIRMQFVEPPGYEVRITDPGEPFLQAQLFHNRKLVAGADVQAAAGQIFELTVRFADLGLEPEAPIHLYFEAIADGQSVDRAPREGVLETKVPGPDYEKVMWQV